MVIVKLRGENLLFFGSFEIDFHPGLNVITGETGAGKSVLVRALQALCGVKDNYDLGGQFYIEALISSSDQVKEKLTEMGLETDEVVVSLSGGKRWVHRINGKMYPRSIVNELLQEFARFHTQNSQNSLLRNNCLLSMLDEFGSNKETLALYTSVYKKLRKMEQEIKEYNLNDLKREIEFLREEVKRFERVNISEQEEKELEVRFKRASEARNLRRILSELMEILENDDLSPMNSLRQLEREISKYAEMLPSGFCDLIAELLRSSDEISRLCRNVIDDLEEEDVDALEQRMWIYNDLKRRYGPEMKDVVNYYDSAKQKLADLKLRFERLNNISEEIKKIQDQAFKLADNLHENRVEAGKKICSEAERHLKDLSMNAKLYFELLRMNSLRSTGITSVELMTITNAGSEPMPVRAVASGGELSRLMLSLELALADKMNLGTLIFDEIDSGISGMVGNVLGEKLKTVSNKFQTVVVTHLPQIACLADRHFVVEKRQTDKTQMSIKVLAEDERNSELTRMVGGLTFKKE